jgi:hypothetical protein
MRRPTVRVKRSPLVLKSVATMGGSFLSSLVWAGMHDSLRSLGEEEDVLCRDRMSGFRLVRGVSLG